MKKSIFAISIAAPAIVVNPKRPAIRAKTRNVNAHDSIIVTSSNPVFAVHHPTLPQKIDLSTKLS